MRKLQEKRTARPFRSANVFRFQICACLRFSWEGCPSPINAGSSEVMTAVSFRTGSYRPDFHALETDSDIVLPWDRETIVDGELRPNPKYGPGGGY